VNTAGGTRTVTTGSLEDFGVEFQMNGATLIPGIATDVSMEFECNDSAPTSFGSTNTFAPTISGFLPTATSTPFLFLKIRRLPSEARIPSLPRLVIFLPLQPPPLLKRSAFYVAVRKLLSSIRTLLLHLSVKPFLVGILMCWAEVDLFLPRSVRYFRAFPVAGKIVPETSSGRIKRQTAVPLPGRV
jgi:hypothetical protein